MNKNITIEGTSDGKAYLVFEGERTLLEGDRVEVAGEEISLATLAMELQAVQNELTTLKREYNLETDPQAEDYDGNGKVKGVAPISGGERYSSTEVDPKASTPGANVTTKTSE